jgi:hypothetical protein
VPIIANNDGMLTTELAGAAMLQRLPQECGVIYQLIVEQAVAAGDIPAGTVQP